MALRDVKLNDKYDLGQRRVFVTGFQALVRLCLMQKELDRRNGLKTAGFITGYRGSPLGNLDSQFLRAEGCVEVQGYLFSRPKPLKEIPSMLRELRPRIRAA